MQLGSTTLGRVNDEDAEKGLVYWDVFKTARLENLKSRTLDDGGCWGIAWTSPCHAAHVKAVFWKGGGGVAALNVLL